MVSVIMPVYNSEKYLDRAIQSILEQTYKDFELIIVDDGSTDSSRSIINKYAQMDHRIRFISQVNAGVSAARNVGIREVKGEWIYFIDSDDYVDSCFLQEVMAYSESFDMIIAGVHRHYDNEIKQDRTFVPINMEVTSKSEYGAFLGNILRDRSQDLVFNYLWNRVIRSSIVTENKILFDENITLGEDFFFICDLLNCSIKIKTISKAYYHYNIHGNTSLVGKFYINELDRRKLVYQRIVDLYSFYSAYNQYRNYLEIREGRASYISLTKFKSQTCDLSVDEKIKYINGFLRERKKFMSMYLGREGGVRNKLMKMLIQIGNAKLVYFILSM